jgi:hypothetical protein
LLILLLGFNSFGLFFLYWGEIQLCKIKADEYSNADYIPPKPLTIFSSANRDFKIINKTEILSHGKLYDIVKTQISDGVTSYYTLSDEEEDSYVQSLTDWAGNNTEEKNLPAKTITFHLAKYFNVEKYADSFSFSLRAHSNVKIERDHFFYASPLKNIFFPPPDNI